MKCPLKSYFCFNSTKESYVQKLIFFSIVWWFETPSRPPWRHRNPTGWVASCLLLTFGLCWHIDLLQLGQIHVGHGVLCCRCGHWFLCDDALTASIDIPPWCSGILSCCGQRKSYLQTLLHVRQQGRIQDLKLGAARMDWKIWKSGRGLLPVGFTHVLQIYDCHSRYISITKYFRYDSLLLIFY